MMETILWLSFLSLIPILVRKPIAPSSAPTPISPVHSKITTIITQSRSPHQQALPPPPSSTNFRLPLPIIYTPLLQHSPSPVITSTWRPIPHQISPSMRPIPPSHLLHFIGLAKGSVRHAAVVTSATAYLAIVSMEIWTLMAITTSHLIIFVLMSAVMITSIVLASALRAILHVSGVRELP